MEQFDLSTFRESIKDYSVEELEKLAKDIQNDISKMILNSELILRAAVVDSLIKEKKEFDA